MNLLKKKKEAFYLNRGKIAYLGILVYGDI